MVGLIQVFVAPQVVSFSAGLRLSAQLNSEQRRERVLGVIHELGLAHVAQSVIRVAESSSGISGA